MKHMDNYFYNMVDADDMRRLNYIPTVGEFLDWIEKEYTDLPALSHDGETLSYKDFCSRIARRRGYIASLGLPEGSHIAILDRNSRDAIELFLAITSSGHVAVILPSSLPATAVAASVSRFDIAAIFVREEFATLCEGIGSVMICAASSIAEEPAPAFYADPKAPAAIFFTGGTTGTPKGAVLSQQALMRGSFNAVFKPGKVIGVHRYVALLPVSHVFGLISGMMGCFYTGNLLFTCEDMKATIGQFSRIKPTLLVIVPGICDILAGLVKMYGEGFLGGELRMIIAGAANVPPRLVETFSKMGVEFCFGYGLTEGANLTSANADAVTHPTSIGKIYPGQETRIVDGELQLRGDNIFSGYYKDPQKTLDSFTSDGWFRTGDLCHFDKDGFLYVTGRIKNLILLPNGENVSPEELEAPFYEDPFVKDVLVKEDTINDRPVIAIEIYPLMSAFQGKPWDEVEEYMYDLVLRKNTLFPTTHRITKLIVRKEDFKRTGAMKVSRNQ